MTVPTISVVMPAYNAEKYLREAIDSILSQTFGDFEFIIVNDGSTDRTKEIILSYDDPRIVYLENEQNSGICVTLNKGLEAARGRYIARMDADDISLPERFEKQVRFMDQNPEIGLSGTYLQLMDENKKFQYIFENAPSPDECRINMIFGTCVGHPSVIMRKDIIEKNGLRYDEYYRGMEDFHLWWQMAKFTAISNIPEPLLNYRCHSSQVTQNQVNKDFLRRQKEFLIIRLKDMGLSLTAEEVNILNQYMVDSGSFDDETLDKLISALKNVFSQLVSNYPRQKSKLRLYIAKAISLVMDRSIHRLHRSKFYYSNKALSMGCMPFIWWAKRTYYYIIS